MRAQLSGMHALKPFYGFHLDDDGVLDEKIEAVPAVKRLISINDGHWLLPLDDEP